MSPRRTVADVMTRELVVLAPEDALVPAMAQLAEARVSGAPVVDAGGQLVGLLTEKDCFAAAYEASYHQELLGPVSDAMTKDPQTVDAGMDLIEAIELFHRSDHRRFPVLDGGQLVGIVSRRDLLAALLALW